MSRSFYIAMERAGEESAFLDHGDLARSRAVAAIPGSLSVQNLSLSVGPMSPTATAVELKPCPLYINGQPVISRGPKDIQYNPATGEAVAEIPRTTAEEISAAVEAARKAFPGWSKTPVLQRCRVL